MKRSIYLMLAAAMLSAAVSCEKEFNIREEEQSAAVETVSISLSASQESVSVKTVAADGSFTWTSTDEISVFDGTANREFTTTESGSSVKFSGDIASSATSLAVLYPYSSSATYSAGSIVTTIPDEPDGVLANIENVAVASVTLPSAGASPKDAVTFKNACAIIKFTLGTDATHKQITISTSDKEAIAGEVSIVASTAVASSTVNSITAITFGDGASTIAAGTYYFLAIPQEGKEIKFTFNDGVTSVARTTKVTADLAKNEIVDFGTIDDGLIYPEYETDKITFQIKRADDKWDGGSLAVKKGEEFRFVASGDGAAFEWKVPECLDIVSGQGSATLTVKATEDKMLVPAKSVKCVVKTDTEEVVGYYVFPWKIYVWSADDSTIDGYHTVKRYGTKVWMTKNLNYSGTDGSLGKTFPGVTVNETTYPSDTDGSLYGRYYSYQEVWTGKADGTMPAFDGTVKDDMGESHTISKSQNSHSNIQIQGICPEGWHVPNVYDEFDLIVGVAEDYDCWHSPFNNVYNYGTGICLRYDRDDHCTGNNVRSGVSNLGLVASYLRGTSALWNCGKTVSVTVEKVTNSAMPLYINNDNVGFNVLPMGYLDKDNELVSLGLYSFHYMAFIGESNTLMRFTIGTTNVNLSHGREKFTDDRKMNVRCVANYAPSHVPDYTIETHTIDE